MGKNKFKQQQEKHDLAVFTEVQILTRALYGNPLQGNEMTFCQE